MTTPNAPVTATKALVATIGVVLTTLVPILQQITSYLPGPWSAILTGLIGLATVLGVYTVPNRPK